MTASIKLIQNQFKKKKKKQKLLQFLIHYFHFLHYLQLFRTHHHSFKVWILI